MLRSGVLSSVLVVAPILASPLPVVGANWPAWRGDGSGVSEETDLPVVWGATENILWKTEIEGNGASSPVVWGNRVFLTSASEKMPLERGLTLIWALCASLLALILLILGDTRTEMARSRRSLRVANRLDRLGTTLALLLYSAGAVFLFTKRGSLGSASEQMIWIYTGLVTMFACVAAVGLFRVRSLWRLVGSVALIAIALLFLVGMPHSRLSLKRILVLGWAVSVSSWWCLLFFASPRTAEGKTLSRRTAVWRAAGALALILTAIVQLAVFGYFARHREWIRLVICLDADTGVVLWRHECFPARLLKGRQQAMPTPVTDGKRVVAQFSPGLVCLDFSGHVEWQEAIPDYERRFHYGTASSPIMFKQSVIYTLVPDGLNPTSNDHLARFSQLSAVDKETGDVRWQVQLPDGHDSYNTPLLTDVAGHPVVLLATWKQVLAYDPENGHLIRSWDLPVCQCIPSIVAGDGRAYVMSGRDHGSKGGFALNLAIESEGSQNDVAWQAKRAAADISSPVLCRGYLFMVTKAGISTCLEAETGSVVWRKRLTGTYYSSVVADGNRVLFTSCDGKTTVVAIGQAYEEVAENTIGEACSASHAISNGRLFVRGEKHLFCIAAKGKVEG